jgi:hypothetical protein
LQTNIVMPVKDINKTAQVPTCDGAVLCGRQEFPDDFGKRSVGTFRSLVQKVGQQAAGPVVVVTARGPHGGFGDVGDEKSGSWDFLGHDMPELGAWFAHGAVANGHPKLRALPGGMFGEAYRPFGFVRPFDEPRRPLLVSFDGAATWEHNRVRVIAVALPHRHCRASPQDSAFIPVGHTQCNAVALRAFSSLPWHPAFLKTELAVYFMGCFGGLRTRRFR